VVFRADDNDLRLTRDAFLQTLRQFNTGKAPTYNNDPFRPIRHVSPRSASVQHIHSDALGADSNHRNEFIAMNRSFSFITA
jgi:hypothetical protein